MLAKRTENLLESCMHPLNSTVVQYDSELGGSEVRGQKILSNEHRKFRMEGENRKLLQG